MQKVLSDSALAFLKVTGAALIVVAIGVTAQSNLNGAVAVGIAGLMAAVAAGVAAAQVFLERLSFRAYLPEPWGALADSFVHGFLGGFLPAITGWLAEPNYSAWRAVLIGAVVGGLNAGFRAIQGSLTPQERPFRGTGIQTTGAELPPA